MSILKAAALILVLSTAIAGSAAVPNAADEKTPAAVIASDNAWGAAETRGDTEFISWLLMPEYRSIGPDGRMHDRAAVLASTAKHNANAQAVAASASYKAAHPTSPEVTIIGDTAILRWVSTRADTAQMVNSCDIFVYRDGHWHAAYSQHTTAGL